MSLNIELGSMQIKEYTVVKRENALGLVNIECILEMANNTTA